MVSILFVTWEPRDEIRYQHRQSITIWAIEPEFRVFIKLSNIDVVAVKEW